MQEAGMTGREGGCIIAVVVGAIVLWLLLTGVGGLARDVMTWKITEAQAALTEAQADKIAQETIQQQSRALINQLTVQTGVSLALMAGAVMWGLILLIGALTVLRLIFQPRYPAQDWRYPVQRPMEDSRLQYRQGGRR